MINLLRGLIVPGASLLLALVVTAPTAFLVSAQYVQDHQHIYFDPLDYPVSSQALTVVSPPEGEGRNEYAFVAGFKPQDILQRRITRPLIVKLEPNRPIMQAFDLDWHKTYYFPNEIDNQSATQINLYARDIHYVNYGDGNVAGYIICGKVTEGVGSQEADTGSFLLLTDLDGNPTKFMVYKSIKELNSVVPTKGDVNPQGFVAVGTAGTGGRDTAAYLSVDIDLSPVCHSVTEGKFRDSTPNTLMESTFKKIIQYGPDNFAMVGHTSKDPTNCETRDTDILVSVKTQRCGTVESSHYGLATSTDEDGNPIAYKDEFGMSLAEARPGRGRGLIITGLVKETPYSCPTASYPPTYEDGFIMKLKNSFKLQYFQRFDYDTDLDIGLAVAVIRNRIWVSGETTTSFFITTSTLPNKRDIFLLEFKFRGSLENSHLYGGPEDDGGLAPGNLDLESSQEGFPIILGNTKNFFTSAQQSAYLIEHYRSTKKRCNRKDERPNLEEYRARKLPNADEEKDTAAEEMSLVAKDVRIEEKVPCEKLT
jgi:hypothetical protein